MQHLQTNNSILIHQFYKPMKPARSHLKADETWFCLQPSVFYLLINKDGVVKRWLISPSPTAALRSSMWQLQEAWIEIANLDSSPKFGLIHQNVMVVKMVVVRLFIYLFIFIYFFGGGGFMIVEMLSILIM